MQKLTFYKRIAKPILYIVGASLEIETHSVETLEIFSHPYLLNVGVGRARKSRARAELEPEAFEPSRAGNFSSQKIPSSSRARARNGRAEPSWEFFEPSRAELRARNIEIFRKFFKHLALL